MTKFKAESCLYPMTCFLFFVVCILCINNIPGKVCNRVVFSPTPNTVEYGYVGYIYIYVINMFFCMKHSYTLKLLLCVFVYASTYIVVILKERCTYIPVHFLTR